MAFSKSVSRKSDTRKNDTLLARDLGQVVQRHANVGLSLAWLKLQEITD